VYYFKINVRVQKTILYKYIHENFMILNLNAHELRSPHKLALVTECIQSLDKKPDS